MKKLVLASILALGILFGLNSSILAAEITFHNKVSNKLLMSSALSDSFRQLPSKSNVSLDKTWTVTFTSDVTMDKVEGVLVQKDSDFVPVNIAISGQNKMSIKPVNPYAANSKYSLKLFLSNGKKCNMDFTTEDAFRNADSSDNDSYANGGAVYLGDKLKGNLDGSSDKADWYKLTVTKDASVNISLNNATGKNINLYLYGKNGDNNSTIADDYNWNGNKSVRYINDGLAAGTYYIKVSSNEVCDYSMNIDYTSENESNDDETNDTYLTANAISLNSTITGHIANANEDNSRDTVDFYKFTLDKDSTVSFNVSHNAGSNINIYLYGKDGTNFNAIDDNYNWNGNKSVRTITDGLAAGTYYVKISSDSPGTYSLKSTSTEDVLANDTENNDLYLKALKIDSNDTKTGHIGYLMDNNSQDQSDWYTMVLDQDKEVNIDLTSEYGSNVNLYLYGENGDNDSTIADDYNWNGSKSVRHITKSLTKGVYYIKVNSKSSSGYTLKTNY